LICINEYYQKYIKESRIVFMSQKPLIDFTDKELYDALHHEVKNVVYFANDYIGEMSRRSQDRNTKALNIWTYVIAIATLINAIATLFLVLKSIGSL
jgi:hypothetical protein